MIGYIFFGALIILAIYVISIYNFFASSKTRVGASIQEIGNQLKRQAELIPNLEASVKGYLKHEKGIFEDLTEARKSITAAVKSGNLKQMADAGKMLNDVLPRLQVVVESNPEIKGTKVVEDLMEELRDTSDKVMYARRLLIDLTADYNVKRVTFPSSFIAAMFHFEELKGLEAPTEEEAKTPKISF